MEEERKKAHGELKSQEDNFAALKGMVICVCFAISCHLTKLLAEHERILQEEREQSQKASKEHKHQIESLEGMLYQCFCKANAHCMITAEYERMLKEEREQHEKVAAEHLEKIKALEGNL